MPDTIPTYCPECGRKTGEVPAGENLGHAAILKTCEDCKMERYTADEAVIEM